MTREFVGHNHRETNEVPQDPYFSVSIDQSRSWWTQVEMQDVDMFNFLCDNSAEGDGPESSDYLIDFRYWILQLKGT